jgi:hypothetical protein
MRRSNQPDKRLVFTVTPGRSGSEFLALMMECIPTVASYHEPVPNFVEVMRAAQTDPALATRFWVEKKLPEIGRAGGKVYVETSHLFCKGFYEPLLELGIRPDLILLTRPHRQVAVSLYKLDSIPGRTEGGIRWYLGPEDPGVLPIHGWQELHDYQLCYWYCLEIERRQQEYARMALAMGCRVASTSLDEIKTLEGFSAVRRKLDLPSILPPHDWYRYLTRRRKRANAKQEAKRSVELPPRLAELESEVHERIAVARERGEGGRPAPSAGVTEPSQPRSGIPDRHASA